MSLNNKEEKKESVVLKITKYFLSTLFPFVRMMVLNRKLTLAEKTVGAEAKDSKGAYVPPYDWFKRQKMRNIIFGFAGTLPLILSLFISYKILTTNDILVRLTSSIKKDVMSFHLGDARRKYVIVGDYLKKHTDTQKEIQSDIHVAIYSLFFGLVASFGMGITLVYFHPIIVETNKLKKYLAQAGYIKLDENPEVLATPIGFLIDITGNTPKEIADSDRIWIPLNIRVNKDWAENPTKRSLVFFKKAYELKSGGEYGFTQIPK